MYVYLALSRIIIFSQELEHKVLATLIRNLVLIPYIYNNHRKRYKLIYKLNRFVREQRYISFKFIRRRNIIRPFRSYIIYLTCWPWSLTRTQEFRPAFFLSNIQYGFKIENIFLKKSLRNKPPSSNSTTYQYSSCIVYETRNNRNRALAYYT